MANFELPAAEIAVIPILTVDSAGAAVPMPSGDVFTAVSSDAAQVLAEIDLVTLSPVGTPGLKLTPKVPSTTAVVVITVSDSAGLIPAVLDVDVIADLTPKAIMLDVAHAVMHPLP